MLVLFVLGGACFVGVIDVVGDVVSESVDDAVVATLRELLVLLVLLLSVSTRSVFCCF